MGAIPLALTNVTVDSLMQELKDALGANFTDWSDQSESNNMIMLLEAVSLIGEMNFAYINKMGREAFMLYALDPRNVIAHAKALGYTPQFQTPSSVSAVIVSANPLSDTTVIPVGTKFTSSLPGVYYETVDNTSILAGQIQSPLVTLKQQESWTDDFLGTALPNQQVELNKTPVMPTSIQVIIDGVQWDFVENFVDSDATSTVFTWLMTSDGTATVVFGNGVSGKKPSVNASGRVFYKTGGGKPGAIGPNQLGQATSVINDVGNGALLSLTAVNTTASIPGSDAETISQIRSHAIANLKAPRVLLTLEDIEGAVSSVPGVFSVRAANWQLIPALPRYIVQIYIVPNGMGQPNDQLLADINTMITTTKPLVMGLNPVVSGATYKVLNFQISAGIKPGFIAAGVQAALRQQLTSLFDPTVDNIWKFTPAFGSEIFMSQISAVLQQVDGVRNIVILAPGDVTLAMNEYPVLGTINFV